MFYYFNKIKSFILAFVIVVAFAFFLGLSTPVLANEINIVGDYDDYSGSCWDRNSYQSFTGTGFYLDRIRWYGFIASGTPIYVNLCDSANCNGTQYRSIYFNPWSQATSTYSYLWFDIDDLADSTDTYLASGTTYYLVFNQDNGEPSCPVTDMNIALDYDNPYSGGRNWVNANYDNWIIINGQDYTDEINIIDYPDDDDLLITVEAEQDLVFDKEYYCMVGFECRLRINYSRNLVNHTLYLLYDTPTFDIPGDAIDDVNLIQDRLMFDYLSAPTGTTTGQLSLMLFDRHPDLDPSLDKLYDGITLYYTDSGSKLMDLFGDICLDDPCADVATTTGWLSGTVGDIECAGKRIGDWLLCPATTTVYNFVASYDNMKQTFPFSIYQDFKGVLTDFKNATSSNNLTLNWSTFSLPYDQEMVIASSTMMSGTFGTFWDTVYDIMKYSLWLGLILYLFKRIISLTKKRKEV